MSMAAIMAMQAADDRRRRDESGRYMDGGRGGNQYPSETRNTMETMTRPMWPLTNMGGEMRRRNAGDNGNQMGGEGWFAWDEGDYPDRFPPQRYGRPGMSYAEDSNVVDMRTYDRRRNSMNPESHMHGEEKNQNMMHGGKIGFGEQDAHGKKLTKEKAEKWVKHMRTDGHKGEMWTMEDAKELAKLYGITEGQELIDFYAALNMVYSNYCEVAKEWGVDDEEYFAALACAFLYDEDGKAPSEKIAAHYKYVVPHEED